MASLHATTNGTSHVDDTSAADPPLKYKVIAKCSTTKARVGVMTLRHGDVDTPVFMPVGTQGTMKGVLPEQLYNMDCRIILANTYHLGLRPVSIPNVYEKLSVSLIIATRHIAFDSQGYRDT